MPGRTGTRWRGDIYFNGDVQLQGNSRLSPQNPTLHDHFITTTMASTVWQNTETGAGAGKAAFAISNNGVGGLVAGVAGATSLNAEELAAATNVVGWKMTSATANNPLFIEARFKAVGTTTAADGDFFVGFSNVVTATSGRAFSISAASAVTTGITDGAMIGYSSIVTSGAFFQASGNQPILCLNALATVAAGVISGPLKIKDSAFHIFRVELDGSGDASYYYDGQLIGAVAGAVTSTATLTPYISAVSQNSHNNTVTVDYVTVGGVNV